MTLLESFRAQLDAQAAYITLAEQRGDGVQVVLSADAGLRLKEPKVTAYGAPLTAKRNSH